MRLDKSNPGNKNVREQAVNFILNRLTRMENDYTMTYIDEVDSYANNVILDGIAELRIKVDKL